MYDSLYIGTLATGIGVLSGLFQQSFIIIKHLLAANNFCLSRTKFALKYFIKTNLFFVANEVRDSGLVFWFYFKFFLAKF